METTTQSIASGDRLGPDSSQSANLRRPIELLLLGHWAIMHVASTPGVGSIDAGIPRRQGG